jgi:hypothetical protein
MKRHNDGHLVRNKNYATLILVRAFQLTDLMLPVHASRNVPLRRHSKVNGISVNGTR